MTDEQRAERLRYHMYESNEGIREHAERIVALEELVDDFYQLKYSEFSGITPVDDAICELCEKNHGGESPCVSETGDMTEKFCKPTEAEYFKQRMAALGLEA